MSGFLFVVPPTQGAEHRDAPQPVQGHSSGAVQGLICGTPQFTGLPGGSSADLEPATALVAAWRQWGPGLLDHLRGGYALAVHDRQQDEILLAVDRLGIGTLSYAEGRDGSLVVGTSTLEVARHPQVQARLDPQAVHDYMFFHMVPSPGTAFAGVSKLEPGCCIRRRQGRLQRLRYWTPGFTAAAASESPALQKELMGLLQQAVGRHLPADGNTGAFLSGGLDSSSVAGMLSRVTNGQARTFSVGFPEADYNELDYARLVAKHFGTQASETIVLPSHVEEALPLIAAAYDEPFGNSSAVPVYFCARLAKSQGVSHLLAGDGGDELFGGNPHYARQLVFDAYYRLPGPLRRTVCEGLLLRAIPGTAPFPLNKLRSYIDQARIPLPRRLQSWNYMLRHDQAGIFSPEFLATVDPDHPGTLMDQVYAESDGAETINRLLFFDWHFVLADSDLRKVNRMCELAGVAVSYPMLDDSLVDFSLRVPANEKTRKNQLRPFFKEATAGFLPPAVINKSKHGFGLPFGLWLKTDPGLRALMNRQLSALGQRGIFRPEWLQTIVHEHEHGHASHHGYVIWDLIMLEEWLATHQP